MSYMNSMDTDGKLNGYIHHNEIINYISQHIDPHVTADITTTVCKAPQDEKAERYLGSHKQETTVGFIYFTSKKGRPKSMFYSYIHVIPNDYEEHDVKHRRKDMENSETTLISLPYDEESVDIMTQLVRKFGGWIDKNDEDDIPFEPVSKSDEDKMIKIFEGTIYYRRKEK